MELHGRRVIYADADHVDESNIVSVIEDAEKTHMRNRTEITYLWNYYKGDQPILRRVKNVRKEINNKIVINRANEIVSFKVGYLCGEPIQYVGKNSDERVSAGISQLNAMMDSEDKAAKDREIVEWQMVCGTAYRILLPDGENGPFEMYTLDPRSTFVIYDNTFRHRKIAGVSYSTDTFGTKTYTIYTKSLFMRVRDGKVLEAIPHGLSHIPIFEYPANAARLGAFEIVITMLDAINTVASSRVDGIEQFVQSFMKFVNCDISTDDYEQLKAEGAIKIQSKDGQPADVSIITAELNQTQTQTLADDMYQTVLTICGVPNRNGGSSTSDTGQAVVLRDGWSLAESRAKDSELSFKRSENDMMKLVLRILRDADGVPEEAASLQLSDISMQFTRRNYENIQSKAQVLTGMLACDKIHPRLAFTGCGMFPDPESAYAESMDYYADTKRKEEEALRSMELSEDEDEPVA